MTHKKKLPKAAAGLHFSPIQVLFIQEVGKDGLVAAPHGLRSPAYMTLVPEAPAATAWMERGDFYGALSNVWAEVGAPEGATFVPPLIQADVYALNYTLEPFISSGNRNISKVSNLCLLGLFLGSYCSSYWHIGSIKPGVSVCLQCEQHLAGSDVFSSYSVHLWIIGHFGSDSAVTKTGSFPHFLCSIFSFWIIVLNHTQAFGGSKGMHSRDNNLNLVFEACVYT